jgi:basic membrane lipoprotein Med (substrate-binding protein (PBP1-ABC) superfamily)
VHTAYVENVAEGADAEQVIRSLARKGFNTIFTTSFGFMDASETVAWSSLMWTSSTSAVSSRMARTSAI